MGGLGGQNAKVWKIYQTAGPIGTKFGTRLRIHLGIDIKTISPAIHQGAFGGGGFRGQKFKSLENLPNGWTDWHQIWYTSADSYGNGHRLKTNNPSRPGGHFGV